MERMREDKRRKRRNKGRMIQGDARRADETQREENKAREKEIFHEDRGKEIRRERGREVLWRYSKRLRKRREREGNREWRHKNCGLNIERDFLCKRPAVTNLSDVYGKVGWQAVTRCDPCFQGVCDVVYKATPVFPLGNGKQGR